MQSLIKNRNYISGYCFWCGLKFSYYFLEKRKFCSRDCYLRYASSLKIPDEIKRKRKNAHLREYMKKYRLRPEVIERSRRYNKEYLKKHPKIKVRWRLRLLQRRHSDPIYNKKLNERALKRYHERMKDPEFHERINIKNRARWSTKQAKETEAIRPEVESRLSKYFEDKHRDSLKIQHT